ncbi:alpha/beta fold hydrolase [Paraburkholderia jirisanensis]
MESETHTVISADGLRLAVYVSGPRDATPVVLVHGYPDSALIWEAVRAQLDARFRVIAYDVRGAGASDAPAGRTGYRLEALVADLAAVADALIGTRPFHLVGHDWGSIQCWEAVTTTPLEGRIASYTSISGPCLDHAAARTRGLPRSANDADTRHAASRRTSFGSTIAQLLKSWYIYFFHLPLLPELYWRLLGVPAWPWWLRVSERLQAVRDPAQLRNALNGLELYRANFVSRMLHPHPRSAHAPVQFIVPLRDPYVGPALSVGLETWLGPYRREEIDAGHWVVLREPMRVAASIARFIARHEPAEASTQADQTRDAQTTDGTRVNNIG